MPPKTARGAMKRPAAAKERVRKASRGEKPKGEDLKANSFKKFASLDLRQLVNKGPVALEDARYYGQAAPVAGHFQGLKSEGEGMFIRLKVSGTKNEELLRVLSGKKNRCVNVHLCEEGCAGLVTDELLVHASGFEETELSRVPWLTNLQGVQEGE